MVSSLFVPRPFPHPPPLVRRSALRSDHKDLKRTVTGEILQPRPTTLGLIVAHVSGEF